MKEHKTIALRIQGRVQGVGFRYSAGQKSTEMGLTLHMAENLPDGSVSIVIEGPQKKLDDFVEWVHTGPPVAGVESVSVHSLTD